MVSLVFDSEEVTFLRFIGEVFHIKHFGSLCYIAHRAIFVEDINGFSLFGIGIRGRDVLHKKVLCLLVCDAEACGILLAQVLTLLCREGRF